MNFQHQPFYYPAPGVLQPEAVAGQGLHDFIGCLRRRKKIIALFTVFSVLCGLIYALGSPRPYEAHASLLVQLGENKIDREGGYAQIQASQESIILSTVEMLQSADIAESVIHDLKLNIGLKQFQNRLTVRPMGRSLLIDIAYRDADARRSALILQRLITAYQQRQHADKGQEAAQSGEWLNAHMNDLSAQVRKSAQAVQSYRAEKGLYGDEHDDVLTEQTNEIASQLILAKAEQAAAQAQQTQLQTVLQDKKPAETMETVLNGRMITLLKRDEAALQSQRAELQSKYGPNHPRMKAITAELDEIRAKKEQALNHTVSGIVNKALVATAKVAALESAMADLQKKQLEGNAARIELHELERQAESDRTLYENFLARYKNLTMADDLTQPDIKIVSAPRVPLSATGTPHTVLLGLFALFGFIFGIFAALMLEQLENHIRTPEQLRAIAPYMPLLAMIPQSDDFTNDETFIESVRALRIGLSANENGKNILAVTSALAGEGKSTLSLWLARILAASGKNVLLIDGDLRQTGLCKALSLNNFYSVSDMLLKRVTMNDLIAKDTKTPTLSILSGKTAMPADLDRLTREHIKTMLANATAQYDIVIVDTPPSALAAETIWWLQEATKSLYAVQWDHTPFDIVRDEIKRLKTHNVALEGFVLTQMNAHEYNAYGYHEAAREYRQQQVKRAA